MMVKAIVTDLDRTLLRSDKSISEYTVGILEKCRSRGIHIVVATARPERSVQVYQEQIGYKAIAALNGGKIVIDDEVYSREIPSCSAMKILSGVLCIPNILVSVETSNGLYANVDIPEWGAKFFDRFPCLPANSTVYKILVSREQSLSLEEIQHCLTDEVYCTVANGTLYQIMSKKATKWNGVKMILDYFKIAESEAIYFGDDHDDIELLERCGMGVAVANAIPEMLKQAKYVALSNDEDGVAHFIEENIL